MGIFEQINQAKPVYYINRLTKEMFENVCNKAFEKSKENNKWINLEEDYINRIKKEYYE